jgi:hypothetical protein
MVIAATQKLVQKGKVWLVPSQSGNAKYTVSPDEDCPYCSCLDHEATNQPCKHIFAVRIVQGREHHKDGSFTETRTMTFEEKKTYRKVDQPIWDHCQMVEKTRFQELLFDLLRGVVEPVRKIVGGRIPNPLRDQLFACAFKVYSTVSLRRFNCDLVDARAKGYLSKDIHPVKVGAFMESEELTGALESLILQSSLPLRHCETTFAPDSSGFSTSRFVRWFDEKYGAERSGRAFVKAHVMTGTKTNVVTAIIIDGPNTADCPQFKPLVETTAKNFAIAEVSADKAYLSRENLEQIHRLGGTAFIPFKVNSVPGEAGTIWEKMFSYFQFRRDDFLKFYHKRSLVETTFSMVKAKFGDSVRSRSDVAMKNEVLLKFLCHNICCLIAAQAELGIEPVFWGEEKAAPAKEVATATEAPVELWDNDFRFSD